MARIDGSVSASVLGSDKRIRRRACGFVLASVLRNQVWLVIVTAFVAVAIALLVRRAVFESTFQLFDPQGLGF